MDLAPAEELLDYQLASCPEEALWLDMTKIMRVTLSRTTDIKLSDSPTTSVPKIEQDAHKYRYATRL